MSEAATGSAVLLLSETVALVAIVAVFGLALVFLVVAGMFLQSSRPAAPTPAPPITVPLSIPAPVKAVRASRPTFQPQTPMEIDVPTKHVDAVIRALHAAGWRVEETGDVVATDDDEEALTTLSVQLPGPAPTQPATAVGTGEEIR